MWTVVYVAPNRSRAEVLRQTLAREGLLACLRETGLGHNGAVASPVEILVPEGEAEEAHHILCAILSKGAGQAPDG